MASTRSIQVTCEYLQGPPEVYSVQLTGNQTKKEDIVKQLSDSLSSANLNSYIIDLYQPNKAVIRHIRPSHERLMVLHQFSFFIS